MSPAVRLWVFRIATAVVAPLLILGGMEVGLRLVGYGHDSGFTVPCTVLSQKAFCENDRFTRQFFPTGMFRLPYSFAIPVANSPRTYRIVVIGESAAQGVPEPSYSFARYLEAMLRDRFPGVSFEVINSSISSINSHVLLPVARDLARRGADLFVLYIGNNEVVGPFGPETTLTPRLSNLHLIRTGIFLRSTRLGQLPGSALQGKSSTAGEWRGIRMFLEHRVPADAPVMAPVYHNFERNLRDIVQVLRRSGAPVLLSTVGSNLKDSAPFGSLHRTDLTTTQRIRWERLVREGSELEDGRQHRAATDRYLSALEIDDRHAELQFRTARAYLASGDPVRARQHYAMARDLDVLRFRADGRMNEIIRSIAKSAGQEVELVDGEQVFSEASPHGIPGRELFYEQVHMNPHGNYLLARELFSRVAGRLPAEMRQHPAIAPTEAEAERMLALTRFDRRRVANQVVAWLSQPPFTYQLNHEQQLRELQRQAATLVDIEETGTAYQWAIARYPADRWLRFNHGVFLEQRDPSSAMAEFRQAVDLLPNNYVAREKLVDALLQLRKFDEALAQTDELLRRMPYHAAVHLSIAYALAQLGRLDESVAAYQQAIRLQPGFSVEAHNQIGIIQLHQQRFADAAATFERAIELDTARVRLAELQHNLGYARAELEKGGEVNFWATE